MCNQVQSVTLQTAVLLQVKEFAQNNRQFSVHDITAAVRSKTANGELEIPEVEVSGTSFRFDIPHVKVKGLFDELWSGGVFDPYFTLNRKFNGTYFEYTPSLVSQPQSQVSTPPSQSTVTSTANTSNVQTNTVQSSSVKSNVKVDKSSITNRVENYLQNCQNRSFQPTLKQVQSAIKRDNYSSGWSCSDLKDLIEQIGYSISFDPNVDYISDAQVTI